MIDIVTLLICDYVYTAKFRNFSYDEIIDQYLNLMFKYNAKLTFGN
jgi:hypothetical protein